jgi:hypothetical protein
MNKNINNTTPIRNLHSVPDRDSYEGYADYGRVTGQQLINAMCTDEKYVCLNISGQAIPVSQANPDPIPGKNYELIYEHGCPSQPCICLWEEV